MYTFIFIFLAIIILAYRSFLPNINFFYYTPTVNQLEDKK